MRDRGLLQQNKRGEDQVAAVEIGVRVQKAQRGRQGAVRRYCLAPCLGHVARLAKAQRYAGGQQIVRVDDERQGRALLAACALDLLVERDGLGPGEPQHRKIAEPCQPIESRIDDVRLIILDHLVPAVVVREPEGWIVDPALNIREALRSQRRGAQRDKGVAETGAFLRAAGARGDGRAALIDHAVRVWAGRQYGAVRLGADRRGGWLSYGGARFV